MGEVDMYRVVVPRFDLEAVEADWLMANGDIAVAALGNNPAVVGVEIDGGTTNEWTCCNDAAAAARTTAEKAVDDEATILFC